MHHYDPVVVADQAIGRPLVGVLATVLDAETRVPVQAYRDGNPVTLLSGAHGLITEFQTDETTRRVEITAGPVKMHRWCQESIAAASEAGIRLDEVEARPSVPPGGLAGDFLTRAASGYKWTPPIVDTGDALVDVSDLYFIDNGDGTSTPSHPEAFADNADGTSTLIGG